MNPIWIKIDDGETFEGHQGHWQDTFFSNATALAIEEFFHDNPLFNGSTLEIRRMTQEEIEQYPEVIDICKHLTHQYCQ